MLGHYYLPWDGRHEHPSPSSLSPSSYLFAECMKQHIFKVKVIYLARNRYQTLYYTWWKWKKWNGKHLCIAIQEPQARQGSGCICSTNVNKKDDSCPKKNDKYFPVCPKIVKPKLNIDKPPSLMVIIALLRSLHNNNSLTVWKVARKSTAARPSSWQQVFVPQLKACKAAGCITSAFKQQSLQEKKKELTTHYWAM